MTDVLGPPLPSTPQLWWAEVDPDRTLRVGRVGDMWSPTPGSLWWGNYHAEDEAEVRRIVAANPRARAAMKHKTIRLTPPQIELLTDIATKPQMYLRRWSRWEKTGHVLVRHGLATMKGAEPSHSAITITPDGRAEAIGRGIIKDTPTQPEPGRNVTPTMASMAGSAGEHPDSQGRHDPMPVFVIKGKDQLAGKTIDWYRTYCEDEGLTEQAAQVADAAAEIRAWQARHPGLVKLPDHRHVAAADTPAGPNLRAELDKANLLVDRMSALLGRVATALKGEPAPQDMHGWADLPQLAADAKRAADAGCC